MDKEGLQALEKALKKMEKKKDQLEMERTRLVLAATQLRSVGQAMIAFMDGKDIVVNAQWRDFTRHGRHPGCQFSYQTSSSLGEHWSGQLL